MDAVDSPSFVIPLWADLTAVALGGVQGALFASGFQGQRRLDLLGVAIIGILLGMGGGLIRDLLLGLTPATLQSNWYLITATLASIVGMLLSGIFQRLNRAIVMLDAVVIGCSARSARRRPSPSACPPSPRSSWAWSPRRAAACCGTC